MKGSAALKCTALISSRRAVRRAISSRGEGQGHAGSSSMPVKRKAGIEDGHGLVPGHGISGGKPIRPSVRTSRLTRRIRSSFAGGAMKAAPLCEVKASSRSARRPLRRHGRGSTWCSGGEAAGAACRNVPLARSGWGPGSVPRKNQIPRYRRPQRQTVGFTFRHRRTVVNAARMPPTQDGVAVDDQVMRGDGRADIVICGDVIHAVRGGDMFHHHAQLTAWRDGSGPARGR